jgi:hypothetical protein
MSNNIYKKKYYKYKNKYINLKNYIGGNCSNIHQDNYKVKLNTKEIDIYVGITDISNDIPIDTQCESETYNKLYIESNKYLSSLTNFQNFMLWYYTGGTLAKIINNYNLKTYTIDELLTSDNNQIKILYECLLKMFIELLAYKNKFKIEFNDNFNGIYNDFSKIIIDNFDKLLKEYKKILKEKMKDSKIYQQFLNFNNEFDKIKSTLKGITYEVKLKTFNELISQIFDNLYLYEMFLTFVNILFIDKKLIPDIALKLIMESNKEIITITKNAPKTTECIKLYKTIESSDKILDIGKPWKQQVINSLTCSRKTNIGMFISTESTCCLLEVNCNIGVPALFLNYEKTMYGQQMFEVILPIDVIFTVISKEVKSILTYSYKQKEIITKTMAPTYTLLYDKPFVKNIDTYFIDATF